MALFSRKRHEDEDKIDDRSETQRRSSVTNVYVPVSAIHPEKQRMAIYDETGEEADGELEFLNQLAAQVERDQRGQRQPPTSRPPARVEHVVVAEEQALEVFRELKDHVERTSITDKLPLQHVEMSDLLDDLQTTAAALRLRRAA